MAMLIQVTGFMAGMVVMRSRLLRHAPVAMAMWIEVAWRVARVIVVRPGLLCHALVSMAVLIEVTRLVARVVVVLAWLLFWHCCLLIRTADTSSPCLSPLAVALLLSSSSTPTTGLAQWQMIATSQENRSTSSSH